MTFATSSTRPSSSTGRPSWTPAVLGTVSTPAACRSCGLDPDARRAARRGRAGGPCVRAASSIVSTWEATNQSTGTNTPPAADARSEPAPAPCPVPRARCRGLRRPPSRCPRPSCRRRRGERRPAAAGTGCGTRSSASARCAGSSSDAKSGHRRLAVEAGRDDDPVGLEAPLAATRRGSGRRPSSARSTVVPSRTGRSNRAA